MAIRICLDAGHYGNYNRSPVVPSYYESNMNWKLHLKLKAELEAYGFEVITTRENKNIDLSLSKRGKAAKGCDLFMSLHSNAAPFKQANEKVDRVDIYATLNRKAHNLAAKLAVRIAEVMEVKDGGFVKTKESSSGGEWYGVLRGCNSVGVPGMLVEHSFHSNTRSTLWLLEDANLDKLAAAEAAVLAEHYGLTKSDAPAPEPDAPAAFVPYMVRVTDETLNVRSGPGMSYDIETVVRKGEAFTIVEHAYNGPTLWGKLKSGAGWISLRLTEPV